MERGENETEQGTAPDAPAPTVAPKRRRRVWVVAASVALVLLLAGLVNDQFQPFDPYRRGTTHPVQLTVDAYCPVLPVLYLDGRSWTPRDSAAMLDASTYPANRGPVSGTLEVTARDKGELHLDGGATVPYERLPAGKFAGIAC